jgi:hypothetical protein
MDFGVRINIPACETGVHQKNLCITALNFINLARIKLKPSKLLEVQQKSRFCMEPKQIN